VRASPSVNATAGINAIGHPNVIALRSARKTPWTLRFPRRNRNPSLIASQLISLSSSLGGDGRIRRTIAIANTKVPASTT
jgi:hypothetical protein